MKIGIEVELNIGAKIVEDDFYSEDVCAKCGYEFAGNDVKFQILRKEKSKEIIDDSWRHKDELLSFLGEYLCGKCYNAALWKKF